MDKIKIAKELLKDRKQELESWGEELDQADKKFVGATLREKEAQLTRWVLQAQVEVEAFQDYVEKITGQIQQGLDHDQEILAQAKSDDDKAEALEAEKNFINERNAECQHND